MNDRWWNLLWELGILALAGLAYYLWQRNKILSSPSHWTHTKLIELFHLAIDESQPELYSDLPSFVAAAEQLLATPEGALTREFIEQWMNRRLPEPILTGLNESFDWLVNQSHPSTR